MIKGLTIFNFTEEEHQSWYASHQSSCPATYAEYASVHLESLVAPDFVMQAYHSVVIFFGIVLMGITRQRLH